MKKESMQGLTHEQLAESGYNAWRYAQGGKLLNGMDIPVWSEQSEGDIEGWMAAVGRAVAIIEDCENIPVATIAASAQQEYHDRRGGPAWDGLGLRGQLLWQAVIRHTANMMAIGDAGEEDIQGHERFWQEWLNRKLPVTDGEHREQVPNAPRESGGADSVVA